MRRPLPLQRPMCDCVATLRSSLAPGNTALQMVSRFAGPDRPFRPRLGARLRGTPVHRPRGRTGGGRLDSPGVKFSVRQILASAAGAVIAAIIASIFGVKGTIVGVAIGSIGGDDGHRLRGPVDRPRAPGGQAGRRARARRPRLDAAAPPRRDRVERRRVVLSRCRLGADRVVATTGADGGGARRTWRSGIGAATAATDETVQMEPSGGTRPSGSRCPSRGPMRVPRRTLRRHAGDVAADAPCARRRHRGDPVVGLDLGDGGGERDGPRPGGPAALSWKAIAGAAGIVFVLALLFITAVELISGKPLSDIFGGAGSGTTFFGNNPGPAPTSTTTSTPSSTTSTSTTSSSSTSTSTTAPTGQSSTTTSTAPSATTTTTPGRRVGLDDDHDRQAALYQPLNSAGRRSTKLAMPSWESRVRVTISWPIDSS